MSEHAHTNTWPARWWWTNRAEEADAADVQERVKKEISEEVRRQVLCLQF